MAGVNNTYIQIPLLPNNPIYTKEDFAADYLATTGEVWLHNNIQDENGVVEMMGSTRCTEAMAADLKTRWPMMKYDIVNEGAGLPVGFQQVGE